MLTLRQWRWIFFIVGQMILALGIAMTIKGQLIGIGPWDVLHVGLYQKIGLTIGSWSILTGLIIVLVTAAAQKRWPKYGTWLNMLLLGSFIDLFNWLLPDVTTIPGAVGMFVAGVVIMSYGIGLYVSPNMGAGPRDSLMLLIVHKFNVSVKVVRTSIEVIVALLGWALGGPVGIGTVIIALLIGQFVHYAMPQCQRLLLRAAGEPDTEALL
ncbi:putative membrane protein YczE [Sporosarcina sp. NCCP-2716]|uniref:YczE/YyaS/YitT family protein n=1 Tax=Sporosarcina sp. NCCP-2716 TaxID=2943679 RepID=UPI0020836FA8|nr:YitT family protein [Sporosarcina sp. NCCP-2716]GKV69081.1 putative membrane protein YczE [Sporosarcina sp. NCCP-2716]